MKNLLAIQQNLISFGINGSNAPKDVTFGYRMEKLGKVKVYLFDRVFEIISLAYQYIFILDM